MCALVLELEPFLERFDAPTLSAGLSLSGCIDVTAARARETVSLSPLAESARIDRWAR